METLTLNIDGMTCMGCVANITRVLTALPGVDSAVVNKDAANAVITFNPAQQSAASPSPLWMACCTQPWAWWVSNCMATPFSAARAAASWVRMSTQ